jgi:NitT/TauT family transport system permease protein
MSERARRLAWPLGVATLSLGLWEVAVRGLGVKTVVLPAPSMIGYALLTRADLVLEHLWPTLYETVLGFLISAVGGILVAILITYSKIIRDGFYPIIVVSQMIPKVSVAPLFIIWFGMGTPSRLLLALLVAFFPMTINAAHGFQSVDEDYVRMARAYMGGRWQIFTKIRVPHALPHIFSGMKISITLAVIGVIVAEFVASQRGIGYLIVFANGILDTPLMMAAITALSVMGLGLYWIVAAIERVVVYWQAPSDPGTEGTA